MKSLSTRFQSLPLGIKLPVAIASIVYIVTMLLMSLIMRNEWNDLEVRLKMQVRQLASSIGELTRNQLLRRDYWQAYDEMLHVLRDSPASWSTLVIIVENNGQVFVSNRPKQYRLGDTLEQAAWPQDGIELNRWDEYIRASDPILDQEYDLGKVLVHVSLEEEFWERRKLMMITFAIATLIAFLGAYVGLRMSRRMTEPLNAMANAVPLLERGEYHRLPEIPVHDRDEIGRLAMLFNQMRGEIRMRSDVEKQMARAERLSALGRLAVSAAHEIRNPLGGVLNSLKTLKTHAYDPAVRDASMQTMEIGLSQINHIVGSMLGFSREGALDESLDHQGVLSLLSLLEVEASGKQVFIDLQWHVGEVLALPAAPVHQLIFNLASNGIQACSEMGRVVMTIKHDKQMSELHIEITDTGQGMPEDVIEHIFEPFWSSREGGTGLGLWVCCRIVDEFDGMISVESSPGEGTCFHVKLPMPEEAGYV